MSIIRELEIVDLVKDSELARNMEGKRHFEFKLNDKAAKSKLIKGAKRKHFDVVANSSSTNLVFSLGAWFHVVLPNTQYWNQVKEEKTCRVGNMVVKIADIETRKEATGKHIDTVIVFFASGRKVVCHLYNTTQLILVNGHGYANLVNNFLKPFFEYKVSANVYKIEEYNKEALGNLAPKQVRRSSVRYKTGSPFS